MNGKRFRTGIAAAALGLAACVLAAPVAHAEKLSEKTIKKECEAAGGVYSRSGTVSTCTYKDIKGNKWMEWFSGGHYVDTIPW